MKTANDIKKVLSLQIEGYKVLFELLKQERENLIDFNEQGVETLAKEKYTQTLKLRLLEEERLRLMKKLVTEINTCQSINGRKLSVDMNINTLAEITGDSDFNGIRTMLKSLLQSIDELNEFNKVLIDRSLKYVRNNINFLNLHGVNPTVGKTGVFLAKEA
ncbi:flagellar export chaperone FlgN [Candidatus Magnetominusculus xianensis]|uniref:FlgN family protein n=1 Tax=Candidatus Magnetominusculus xianensis TaxID=1748249 RepID=A0ABR5SGI4_9BACT|nr:flagellar export chaperone FlgN [Candidatus Magnetominusculus xianensis]KWT85383.1 putative FlgN family protein [Candidatus Magnetominusculus xianensis]MBF0405138.1 flagellar export chaperone FlgN [Nitrospirota bacterium]